MTDAFALIIPTFEQFPTQGLNFNIFAKIIHPSRQIWWCKISVE